MKILSALSLFFPHAPASVPNAYHLLLSSRKKVKLMTAPPRPTVFVVGDYAPVRSAVSRMLRTASFAAGAFASPEKFRTQYDPYTTGYLVLDIDMPAFNGLELQRILARKAVSCPLFF